MTGFTRKNPSSDSKGDAMRKTVTLFIPTLNEAEGMRLIMPRIQRDWVDQILVMDGQSTDDTVKVAKEFGCDVMIQSKPGIRHAYLEAFPKIRGEWVITFSPDGNCIPEVIPDLISKLGEGYDMVIASRYAKGATSDDDDLMTGFGNWLFTNIINVVHGGRYTDAMGIYRAYRTKLFFELGLDKEQAYSPEKLAGTVIGIEPLLSVRAAKAKSIVTEIPASEPARLAGIRKLQAFRWGAAYMLQIFREVYYPRLSQ
jgi:glycosyltransferase involved in cell wall biosynthesis